MYVIWVVAFFALLGGVYTLFDSEAASPVPSTLTAGMAASMSTYREAVVAYAAANPTFTGAVAEDVLTQQSLLSTDTFDTLWQNYIVPNTDVRGSLVVIYSTSQTATKVIVDMEQLAQGSALAGVSESGSIVSPSNPVVPLPSAIASSIPNGEPVWMAQAYE